MRFFLSIILSCVTASAVFDIPSSNRTDWVLGSTAGVQGGIPNRTVIHATATPGDSDVMIESYVASCPSGQVVYLPAGTYYALTAIAMGTAKGVVIRGAGPGVTYIDGLGAGVGTSNIFTLSAGAHSVTNNNGLGDVAKGASNLVVTSTTGMLVGGMIAFSEGRDTNLVNTTDTPDAFSDGDRWIWQRKVIASIADSTHLTVWPPFEWALTATNTPVEKHETALGPRYVGIENLTIRGYTNGTRVQFSGSMNCWLTNVVFEDIGGRAMQFSRSLFGEVAGCGIDGQYVLLNVTGQGFSGGTQGNGQNSACAIYNNWITGVRNPFNMEQYTRSIYSYNFVTNSGDTSTELTDGSLNLNHGGHNLMNLVEGNKVENLQSDPVHGSSSHHYIYRNFFYVLHPTKPNFRRAIDLCRGQWYNWIVYNILGHPSITFTFLNQPGTNGIAAASSTIYRLGFPNQGNNVIGTNDWKSATSPGFDASVSDKTFITGNYDYSTDSIIWNDSISTDHVMPISGYLTAKPTWFGFLRFPPFDPSASTDSERATMIPAEYRYLYGSAPGPETVVTTRGSVNMRGKATIR